MRLEELQRSSSALEEIFSEVQDIIRNFNKLVDSNSQKLGPGILKSIYIPRVIEEIS